VAAACLQKDGVLAMLKSGYASCAVHIIKSSGSGDESGSAAPERGESGVSAGCASDKSGAAEQRCGQRGARAGSARLGAGCASDKSSGAGSSAAPTRDESAGRTGNESSGAATRAAAAPARYESGVGAGCASDKNGRAECATPTRDESAGCASDKSGGTGSAAPTRNESPGQRAPEQTSCGADARGQRDRQRGPREAEACTAPKERSFSKLQLNGL